MGRMSFSIPAPQQSSAATNQKYIRYKNEVNHKKINSKKSDGNIIDDVVDAVVFSKITGLF